MIHKKLFVSYLFEINSHTFYFTHIADNVAEGIEKENLVVKTMFNPVKNAIVVDSHIKGPKQYPGEVRKF